MSIKLSIPLAQLKLVPTTMAILAMGVATPPETAFPAVTKTAPAVDSTPRATPFSRDTLLGLSGKLWMKLVTSQRGDGVGVLTSLFGDSARVPGVYVLRDRASDFAFVNLVPFSEKKNGKLGTYRMGSWPAEQRSTSERYSNPAGFIRVTPENQHTRISEHFRLRDFLTKDQATVWPKYLVLREGLIDKLELVIGALGKRGVNVTRMSVMSGFRTPQYNERGVGAGGRAQNSRHQYGDAADVFVDNDGNGGMDDLNGDGRVNTHDARFLAQVVEEVEQNHPELTGGVGIYSATGAHGPFVHVDVRGVKARW
jgi:hypothetical protein